MHTSLTSLSKLISLVLRHKPETLGLALDKHGWIPVNALLEALNTAGHSIDRVLLQHIVDTNDKQRFALSDDGLYIRANQGHSRTVDLALVPAQPPAVLYHGTATRFLDSIRCEGLLPKSRQHVHLSRDVETAEAVGQRHGKVALLTVQAETMWKNGIEFYQSSNGVWLTAHVPVQFLEFPDKG